VSTILARAAKRRSIPGPASFGIDDHVIVPQELIGDLHGRLEIAAAVVLEVEEQRLHAFFLQ